MNPRPGRSKVILSLLWWFILASVCQAQAQELHSFTSEPFSFIIGAPLTWTLLPESFPTKEYVLHEKNLADLVKERHSIPIIRIVKAVPDNRTTSPAVQVFVEPDKGQTPVEFLFAASKSAAADSENFQVVRKASEITLNGMKVRQIETTFTVEYPGGLRFPTLSRLWAIPRDKMMFVISVTGQPDDLKAAAKDIDSILGTVRFTE